MKGFNILDSVTQRVAYCGHSEASAIPAFSRKGIADVRVPSSVRRCVVFIGDVNSNGMFRPRATAFLVLTIDPGAALNFPYLVTAEHVITGLTGRGAEIHCRLNMTDGSVHIASMKECKWWHHPDSSNLTDVAVTSFGVDRNLTDHDVILFPDTGLRGQEEYTGQRFGLGDEIFTIGLFKSHHGRQRNIPIIRIGNIAAIPEEPILTTYCGFTDAYLVEARSIAGLSGSPVFVNFLPEHVPGFFPDPRFKRDPEDVDWFSYHFLGLVHGHFDVKNLNEDSVVEDDNPGGINTGIGIVVPAWKIFETLYQSDLINERRALETMLRRRSGVTPDAS